MSDMLQRNYKGLVAFSDGLRHLAYHPQRMEVAHLSEEAWRDMGQAQTSTAALSELQEWSELPPIESGATKLDFGLRSLTLNVTQICNLHCRYCAAGGDGSYGDPIIKISMEKTLPQLKKLLGEVPIGETFNLNFLGGEPLLYPQALLAIADFAETIAQEKQLDLRLIVTTNGTLISSELAEELAKRRFHVNLSLDGPPEINDQARPTKSGKGSSEQALRGLKFLLKQKRQLSSIRITAVFDRRHMEIVKAWQFFETLGVDGIDLNFSHTETDPASSQLFMQEMQSVAELAYQAEGERALKRIGFFQHYFERLDQGLAVENYCGAGKSLLVADARNDLYPCPWLVGDAKSRVGQGEEIFSEVLKEYSTPQADHTDCRSCWARFLCGGGCHFTHQHATGEKNKKDKVFCERTRFLLALCLLYYDRCRRSESRYPMEGSL